MINDRQRSLFERREHPQVASIPAATGVTGMTQGATVRGATTLRTNDPGLIELITLH
jgi:hypothetical protein